MTMLNDVDAVLSRMIELLLMGAGDNWAVALEEVRVVFCRDPKSASSKLLSMYGGMGSLNDVVLYGGGQALVKENNEFDVLRARLYELCKDNAMVQKRLP